MILIILLIFTIHAKEIDKICATAPLESCHEKNYCHDRKGNLIKTSSDKPESCYQDGEAKYFINQRGEKRYYCEYNPTGGVGETFPLVIWLHGGGGDVKNLYRSTNLPQKARQQKFHLIALQSRNVKMPFGDLHDGRHIDSYWWDFKINSSNPDIADMDKLIQTIIEKGSVDRSRIYMIGWSEGAKFSQLYGMIREHHPSPYGNKIAKVVAFSGSSPFHRSYENQRQCQPIFNFKSQLPILLVGHSCDVLACSEEQSKYFQSLNNKNDVISMEKWERMLKSILGNNKVERLITKGENAVSSCDTIETTNTSSEATFQDGKNQSHNRKQFKKFRERMGNNQNKMNSMKLGQTNQGTMMERMRKMRERMGNGQNQMNSMNTGQDNQGSMMDRMRKMRALRSQSQENENPERAKIMERFKRIKKGSQANCDFQTAKMNHLIWPKQHEQKMLDFLFSK